MIIINYITLLFELLLDFFKIPIRGCFAKNVSFCIRKEECSNTIYVGLHEWGGYNLLRSKKLPNIQTFNCGLKCQIERFKYDYNGSRIINLTITMSDANLQNNISFVKSNCDHFYETNNRGKDFGGYSLFYNSIKNKPNSYVILTNSSVNIKKCDFIDDYINYMDENRDVGILGISYCSKLYASLVRNNFVPHLQSFFLLTTIEVLNKVVKSNKGKFPGATIDLKQLLIRDGEVKISQLALNLGYCLAVVTDNGVIKFNNNRSTWVLKDGDCRIGSNSPNCILPI